MRKWTSVALALGLACGPAKEAKFSVRASVEQLHVTHAEPGAVLEARTAAGVVATGTTDPLGSLMFRKLPAAPGYVVRLKDSNPVEQSAPVTVMSIASSAPSPDLYTTQPLVPGLNYLKMRDGTTLSAFVTLPGTVKGFEFLCADFPIVCTPPYDGTALLAGMEGYATVSVNMRGTGCSGGAYDYFEQMQLLDGYDVIEIVAAQTWALHHHVGMVGLSYPGISQLAEHDRLNPSIFAEKINVPVFLTGSWQDEQTGPYFFTLFDRFTSSPAARMTATNGVHIDGLSPQVLAEWQVFLDLFVARRVPVDSKLRNFAPFIFDSVYHSKMQLPATRFTQYATLEEAIAAWKAEPKLRVIFESGAGDPSDWGAPKGTFEHSFAQWPASTAPLRLYFQPGGGLSAQAPTATEAASTFRLD